MNARIYPEERREEAIQATLNQYLWNLYEADEEPYLGERGILG